MFVKVCGITNEEDALLAVALGADAIGFIFAASERQVLSRSVAQITARLPGEVLTIGVFRDALSARVLDVMASSGVKGAQLHGNETPEEVAAVRPYAHFLVKAFGIGSPMLGRASEYSVDAMLVDSESPGSGNVFDWRRVEGVPARHRLILAGGLDAANVGDAIRQVRPWGVDVNSGVESSPGHKDPRKLRAFIAAVRAAEEELERDDPPAPPTKLYDWQAEG